MPTGPPTTREGADRPGSAWGCANEDRRLVSNPVPAGWSGRSIDATFRLAVHRTVERSGWWRRPRSNRTTRSTFCYGVLSTSTTTTRLGLATTAPNRNVMRSATLSRLNR